MRVINEKHETITEYDLSAGYLATVIAIKEDASPVDNVTKFAWADDDYEEVQMYVLNRKETYQPTESERLDALEAALLEMMGVNVDG